MVLSLRERVEVPFGHFGPGRVLMTRDLDALRPRVQELKFYARGVGPVMAIGVSGGSDREELVRYTRAETSRRGIVRPCGRARLSRARDALLTDLSTPDPAAAAFYGALLGWRARRRRPATPAPTG